MEVIPQHKKHAFTVPLYYKAFVAIKSIFDNNYRKKIDIF